MNGVSHFSGRRDLRFWARGLIGRLPRLYRLCLYATRSPRLPLLTTPGSAIVVDGFPRSGNTFAVCAFMSANPNAAHVARHIHLPVQFALAERYGVRWGG